MRNVSCHSTTQRSPNSYIRNISCFFGAQMTVYVTFCAFGLAGWLACLDGWLAGLLGPELASQPDQKHEILRILSCQVQKSRNVAYTTLWTFWVKNVSDITYITVWKHGMHQMLRILSFWKVWTFKLYEMLPI